MKIPNSLALASTILALAFSFGNAFDPSPLQDFCVAINDIKTGVFVNGKFCKDPAKVTADDFFHSGLHIPGNTSNQLGVNVTLLTVDSIAGLNTNGLSIARIDFAPNGGLNPPHHHPRAAELLTVLKGTLYSGFITTNPNHILYSKILKEGDVFLFPFGMIHFQMNIGKTPAVAIAALSSQSPSVMTESNAMFGSVPSVNPDVLSKAFHIDRKLVADLQKEHWVNPE
ncbi:RmlC-like cupins superfamily protein [Euphorbia peplus]|nr:RmlC-like cupins superfamily protein [Euphorbia peplus]